MKKISILFLGLLLGLNVFSQCNTNISICQPGVAGPFSFDTLPLPATNPSTCLNFKVISDPPPAPHQISSFAYIILYITTSGPLNMLIEGSSAPGGGWLDVAIFDITGQANPCASLSPATEIGCNFAGSTGSCNQFGNTFPCPSTVPAPMVNAGDVIMILVENFIQSGGSTFTLELSSTPGSAQTGAPNGTITPAGPFTATSPPTTMSAVNGGGTWSASCGSCIDSITGAFDPALAGVGTHQICYNIGVSPCAGNDCINVTVTAPACDATITPAGPFCTNTLPTNIVAIQNGGVWSGTGITNTSSGAFDPSVLGVGSFAIIYTLPCGDADTITIVVNPAPNTGTNGVLSICSTVSPMDLFNELGGTPDIGGTWSPAMTSGTGMFDPSIDAAGIYTYTVTNSCGTSSSDVVVTIPTNPSAGTNGVASVCTNSAAINLLDSLGGTPSVGGTWSPGLNSGTGVFNPANDAAGIYTYSVNDCLGNPQTATITVTTIVSPNAGTNGVITMCAFDPTTDLFNQLGGSPDVGGSWSPVLNSGTGMFNPTIDVTGTYTYSINSSCGLVSSTISVTVNSCVLPTASFVVSDTSFCSGDCINYTETSLGVASWSWAFPGGNPSTSSDQNPTVCYAAAGTYQTQLIVSNTTGSDTTIQLITVTATPTLTVSPDQTIKQGDEVILSATGSAGSYLWTPSDWLSCATCPITIASPDETTIYTVTLNNNGCEVSETILITVEFESTIYIPNVFSPNGDGINDIFFVQGRNIESLSFLIFDRWGEKVFETNNIEEGWNGRYRGKELNAAVFIYSVKAFFKDGSRTTKTGDVTILK